MKEKMQCICNVFFLTKWQVSIHEAIQRVMLMPMRYSYVPMGVKKIWMQLLKDVIEKIDANIYAWNYPSDLDHH